MQSQPKKKLKAGDQQTLFGERAFDPNQDCVKCKGKLWGRDIHRAHHPLCWNNRLNKGIVSLATLEEKRLQEHFAEPLAEKDKCSGKYVAAEGVKAFFTPRQLTVKKSTTKTTTVTLTVDDAPIDFCKRVTAKIDASFLEEHKDSRAPPAMIALAAVVVEELINEKKDNIIFDHFNGMTMTVPHSHSKEVCESPHYHSIIDQKLLYVNWKRMFGLEVNCPRCPTGILENKRSNFSHNKTLFPIFGMDGAPRWCIILPMVCTCCRGRYQSNADDVLRQIPGHARSSYPVEPKYAQVPKHSHLGKDVTQVLDLLMPTYGNGDLIRRPNIFANDMRSISEKK